MRYLKEQGFRFSLLSGLRAGGRIILRRAKYYAPEETGALRASGHVILEDAGGPMVTSDWAMSLRIVFDAPYAVYVHENTSAFHTPPTCAKFLEKAVRETSGDVSRAFRFPVEHMLRAGVSEFQSEEIEFAGEAKVQPKTFTGLPSEKKLGQLEAKQRLVGEKAATIKIGGGLRYRSVPGVTQPSPLRGRSGPYAKARRKLMKMVKDAGLHVEKGRVVPKSFPKSKGGSKPGVERGPYTKPLVSGLKNVAASMKTLNTKRKEKAAAAKAAKAAAKAAKEAQAAQAEQAARAARAAASKARGPSKLAQKIREAQAKKNKLPE